MHPDHLPYARFCTRRQLERSINTLAGLIEGIAIDRVITSEEIGLLELWLSENADLRSKHPFNELAPVVESALIDHVLTEDERTDILWLCEKLRANDYVDSVTADIQRLHAVIGGIAADGRVTESEIRGLSEWLGEHEHLRTCWPYDEIESLVVGVMRDGVIDEAENDILRAHFAEFTALLDDKALTSPLVLVNQTLGGLCAVCPEIEFRGSEFCFTGASSRYTRSGMAHLVEKLGGRFSSNVTKSVRYLVIGADGNPCWAYACYGRKVEKAVELRKAGGQIILVHENDFHDAVADVSGS